MIINAIKNPKVCDAVKDYNLDKYSFIFNLDEVAPSSVFHVDIYTKKVYDEESLRLTAININTVIHSAEIRNRRRKVSLMYFPQDKK